MAAEPLVVTSPPPNAIMDVAVIGGGVVGCGVLRALALKGLRAVLLEREDAVAASWASAGNTGIACTAADATIGTLERSLLARAEVLNRPAYEQMNVPHRRCGSLYVAWGEAGDGAAGDGGGGAAAAAAAAGGGGAASEEWASLVSLAEAHGLDPANGVDENAAARFLRGPTAVAAAAGAALGGAPKIPLAALHVLGEIVVDPWLVPIAWVTQAVVNGAQLRLKTTVTAAHFTEEEEKGSEGGGGVWRLTVRGGEEEEGGSGEAVFARRVVNCGGLWADDVQGIPWTTTTSSGGGGEGTPGSEEDPASFSILPRRGDYLIFGADAFSPPPPPPPPPLAAAAASMSSMSSLSSVPLVPVGGMPVAGGLGRGAYLWRTVHGDLLVGPTSFDLPRHAKNGNAHQWTTNTNNARKALPAVTGPGNSSAAADSDGAHPRQAAGGRLSGLGEPSAEAERYLRDFAATCFPRQDSAFALAKGSYSGLRPCLVRGGGKSSRSTDYHIRYNSSGGGEGGRPQWATVAGIRSTGLTASLAIGEHVAGLLLTQPPPSTPAPSSVLWPVLPSLPELCASFAARNDGCVDVKCRLVRRRGGEGGEEAAAGEHTMTHRVTHPQTRFALATRPPFLPIATAAPLRPLKEALANIGDGESSSGWASPLSFLTSAAKASVLRGGLTNALYVVDVPSPSGSSNDGDNDDGDDDDRSGLWVVRKSSSSPVSGDDPMHRIHRICRECEHRCVAAAWAAGLTPRAFFDRRHLLLAQAYIAEPQTLDAATVALSLDECVDLLKALHETVPAKAFDRSPPPPPPPPLPSGSASAGAGAGAGAGVGACCDGELAGHLDGHVFDVFETAQHYLSEVRKDSAAKRLLAPQPQSGGGSGVAAGLTDWAAELPDDTDALFAAAARLSDALRSGKLATSGDGNKWADVPCHNDLVVGNFVRGRCGGAREKLQSEASSPSSPGQQRRLFLIDFEYSALGDRCFDLANLCVNSSLRPDQIDQAVRRYFTSAPLPAMARDLETVEALVAEGRARVELLRLLSDLREGLWSFAHGLAVEQQQPASGGGGEEEEEEEQDSSTLPPSFYKQYGRQHLDRFRRNLRLHSGDIDDWIRTVSSS